jgi:L-serine dehydratase
MALPPSIFNDVVGPVMRGPSSSHSAAANRIGRLARNLAGEPFSKVIVRYDPNGSLVTTHLDQGSDLGLYSGLLGWPPEDERLPTYPEALKAAGIEIDLRYESYDAPHPNFYRLELLGESGRWYAFDAISTGGGMIELVAIDRVAVRGAGDLHLGVLWLAAEPDVRAWESHPAAQASERVEWCAGEETGGLLVLASREIPEDLESLAEELGAERVRVLEAVLPILSRKELTLPFETCDQMVDLADFSTRSLADLAIEYEAARGGVTADEVVERMRGVMKIMRAAIDTGLGGTDYHDRILPAQSPGFTAAEAAGKLVPADVNNRMIRYVTAIMEVKSSMGVIVAAPTAGSCGAMPGAVLAVAEAIGADEDQTVRALLIAGLIGVFIARDATFAAEEGGCMAECGSGSSMAAAAMVYLMGGSAERSLAAASMALHNNLGMICDPVGNRVEAPCLGRNVMAASNALSCANMALAGYAHLVPLDEVIQTMNGVAKVMPREHCCTSLGGLSIGPTSKRISGELAKRSCAGCGSAKPTSVEPAGHVG